MREKIKPPKASQDFIASLKNMPKPQFSKEQKVVAKAHSMLVSIDENQLNPEARGKISYAGGLLESLLMQDDKEQE